MFKITIEETKTVKKIVGKEWATIGTKEVPRDESFYRQDKDEPKTRIEDVRGYTPEIEKNVEVKATVLTQEVETIDLAAVIKAINKL